MTSNGIVPKSLKRSVQNVDFGESAKLTLIKKLLSKLYRRTEHQQEQELYKYTKNQGKINRSGYGFGSRICF